MHKYHIFLLSFLLGSCHVGEEYHHTEIITPYDVQENLNLKKNGNSVSSAWYEIFKDSDLNTLINHALNNNFTIRQGIERLQQSRYSLMINAKTSYPMIDANGEYNFSKASDNQDYSYDINAFKVGLDASWELDIWGKGKYITEQYYELMHNYQYTLLDLKVSITAEVTGNYIGLREAQEKLFIAQKNLVLQQDILQTVRDKYTAGIADELALNQAEYAVETTKSSIPPLTQQIESYKNAIAVLLGVLPSNLPINLDKYKKNIILWFGRFNQANFGFISSSGNSLFNKDSRVYGYTPGLSLPVWHWGQLTNNIELQKHIKEEYILNYNEAMLTAISEIKNAITATEQAYKTNAYRKNSYYKMRNVMNLTREKYENGLVDFTEYSGFAPVNYLQKILLKYPYAVHVTEKPQTAFNQG